MKNDHCAVVAATSSSLLLLFLASAVGGAAAFAPFGPPGGAYYYVHVPSGRLPTGDRTAACVGTCSHDRSMARGRVLFATSSDDDDDDDDDDGDNGGATDDICGPRRAGRPKVSDEALEERKEQLRELLCTTKAEIEKLVEKDQGILKRRDVVKNYGPKLAMLQERLGISQKAAGKLCLNANRLLTFSLETLGGKIDWLQARLNLNKAQLRKTIERNPVLLTLSIKDKESIQSALQLSNKELAKMISRTPDLLLHNFSIEVLASRLSLLRDLLNVEEGDIATLRKVIMIRPPILFWTEDKMLETQHWVSERLGLSDARIAQMCTNTPQILVSKIETLEGKVDRLQAAMSLSDDELGELFGKLPALFCCDPKTNIEPKLRFLQRRLDLDDQGLKEVVLKCSSLFSRSEKDIEEKIKFYSELVGEIEAKRIVTKSTNLLTISAEKRLKPRLSEIQKAGTKVVWTAQLIQRLARRTDDQWEKYGLGEAPRGGRRRSSD